MNSSGHFLMVITNSANTVDQATQGGAGSKTLSFTVGIHDESNNTILLLEKLMVVLLFFHVF